MEWNSVQRKGFFFIAPRWDCFLVSNVRAEGVQEGVVSLFFLDFPYMITVKDVYDLFGCHGEVVEVVISLRRNNVGKRFGFSSFYVVEDVSEISV